MKNPVHLRAKAAVMLLAFALCAVILGILALVVVPGNIVAQAAPAIVATLAIVVVIIATTKKAYGESTLMAVINMLNEAITAIGTALATMLVVNLHSGRAVTAHEDTGFRAKMKALGHRWTTPTYTDTGHLQHAGAG